MKNSRRNQDRQPRVKRQGDPPPSRYALKRAAQLAALARQQQEA